MGAIVVLLLSELGIILPYLPAALTPNGLGKSTVDESQIWPVSNQMRWRHLPGNLVPSSYDKARNAELGLYSR